MIDPMPVPFTDPARVVWESGLLYAYRDCAARHSATVSAVEVK